jgi:hypothetical protein
MLDKQHIRTKLVCDHRVFPIAIDVRQQRQQDQYTKDAGKRKILSGQGKEKESQADRYIQRKESIVLDRDLRIAG